MFNKKLLSALICPKCRGRINQLNEKEIVCSQCGQAYVVENNTPILIKNLEKLLLEVKQRTKSRPDWYKNDQIDYYDYGPYRHHLKKRKDYLLNILNRYNFKAPYILDAGCGDGVNLRYLLKIPNSTIWGVDYNFERLLKAQKLITNNEQALLILGDLLKQNFADNCFDIILCNHVLEHIEKDFDVLMNLQRMLKPGGLLILGTPNEGAFLWQFNYRVIQPKIMRITDHVHFYTARMLERLLKEAGFQIEEIKFMGWGVPHTGVDKRLRQYKWIDDLFEIIGSRFLKSQATSLYFICKKL